MERGKILTRDVKKVRCDWWRNMYSRPHCAYNPLEVIGFDINFNKFKNHGLELRIFDWFSESELEGVLRLLIWVLDAAQQLVDLELPQNNEVWNRVAERCIWNGGSALISEDELFVFRKATGISFLVGDASGTLDALTAYDQIWNFYCNVWNGTSKERSCTRKMLRQQLLVPRPMWPDMSFMSESIPRIRENYQDIVRVTLKRRITFALQERDQWSRSFGEMETRLHQTQCLPLWSSPGFVGTKKMQTKKQKRRTQSGGKEGAQRGFWARLIQWIPRHEPSQTKR
jgi:hypothetical protein